VCQENKYCDAEGKLSNCEARTHSRGKNEAGAYKLELHLNLSLAPAKDISKNWNTKFLSLCA
jgi:hypothetical protein